MSMLPEAIEEYNSALSLNSQHYDALHNRGCAYHLLGRLEYALSSFRQALSINAEFYPSIRGEAACLISLQRWEEAAASSSVAIGQRPSDFGPLADRAFALLKLCDRSSLTTTGLDGGRSLLETLEGVVSDFNLAISLGDDSPESKHLYGVALSHLAVQQVSRGEFERAEISYSTCISIDETETRVLNQAQLYLRTNRVQMALAGFARAVQIDGLSPQARFAYGTLLLEQGDVRRGLLELHVARDLIQSSSLLSSSSSSESISNGGMLWICDLYYNLGYAELLANEPQTAKRAFEDAIMVNPKLSAAINGIAVAQKMIETSEAVAAELLAVAERRSLAAIAAAADAHHPALAAPIHPSLHPQPIFESSRMSTPDSQLASPTSSPTKVLRRASSIVQSLSQSKGIEAVFSDEEATTDATQSVMEQPIVATLSRLPSTQSLSRSPSTRSLRVLSTQSKEKDSWGNIPEEESISARFRKGNDDDDENDGYNGFVFPSVELRKGLAFCSDDVNPKYKEAFLSKSEFKQLFENMSKKSFYELAKWRRLDMKRGLKLF